MTKLNQKQFDQIKSDLSKLINELSNKVDQSAERDIVQDRDLKNSVQTLINSKIEEVQKDINEIRKNQAEFKEKFDSMKADSDTVNSQVGEILRILKNK